MSPQHLVRRGVTPGAKSNEIGRHVRLGLSGEQPDGATVVYLFHGRGAALFADPSAAGHGLAAGACPSVVVPALRATACPSRVCRAADIRRLPCRQARRRAEGAPTQFARSPLLASAALGTGHLHAFAAHRVRLPSLGGVPARERAEAPLSVLRGEHHRPASGTRPGPNHGAPPSRSRAGSGAILLRRATAVDGTARRLEMDPALLARRHGAILAQRWCCDTAIGRLGAITPEKAAEPVGPLFGARQ